MIKDRIKWWIKVKNKSEGFSYNRRCSKLTLGSEEVPLVITGVYSFSGTAIQEYEIEEEKLQDVQAVRRSQKESYELVNTTNYLTKMHNQLSKSSKNTKLVQTFKESDHKIVIIDFSKVENIKDNDEIEMKLAEQKEEINGANTIWIVDFHIRPKLREPLAQYIDFKLEHIYFVSKIYMQK